MIGSPGSLTMYSTAVRSGLPPPNDTPSTVSPASYYVRQSACRPCVRESVIPFNSGELRKFITPNGYPSPFTYYPYQRPRWEVGCPLMRGKNRFPKDRHFSVGPGPAYKVPDPWVMLLKECTDMASKRWRVKYDKYKSNSVPTVFHPLELRSFMCGVDGKMYPIRDKNWVAKIPGPKYDTSNIRNSQYRNPCVIDFGRNSERPPLFKNKGGFGPADFTIPRCLNENGGIFLSKTDNPKYSNFRYFDFIVCKTSKTIYPSPLDHYIKGGLDVMSPLAVSAPFKSQVPRMGFENRFVGPGPASYFSVVLSLDDLNPPLYPRYPSYFTMPPEPAPFNCTEERFFDSRLIEECCCRPSPANYDIPSFTDLLCSECKRHEPAICNPKLGFLTSADARPEHVFKFSEQGGFGYFDNEPRNWRNVRPRKLKTYPYHGPPPKYPDSPGPIYDTNPPTRAIKGRRDWWDPRQIVDIGFNVSGCTRHVELSSIDKNIPGPGTYYAVKPPKRCSTGTIKTSGPRIESRKISGPGPKYKLHDKSASIWRGTHLGTFNIYLKGVETQYPNAGGYHSKGPLDILGDRAAGIVRPDEYKDKLCPQIIDMSKVSKKRRQLVNQ